MLVMLGSAEPKSDTLTNFTPHITNFKVVGSIEPRIPWDANSLELQRHYACWNSRNFTAVDWCKLA